jgi:DNA polymerase elongation subunit (family B)
MFDLEESYLQIFTYYNLSEMSRRENSWYHPFHPKMNKFALKYEGESKDLNQTVRSPIVQNIDVYKVILKEDPKRFTQYGRGNLNSMLDTFKVKNPYNNEFLQKTDMKINTMFRLWEEGKDIYRIALYCRQDAWICGTLLNIRNKVSDYMEAANISCSTFADSLFRADGQRVILTILSFAYHQKYSLNDLVGPFRYSKNEEKRILGGKEYDTRIVIGGAVKSILPGRHSFVMALDFSGQYPSQKEASNIDSSAMIDNEIIEHPERFGLVKLKTILIDDVYGKREVIYLEEE